MKMFWNCELAQFYFKKMLTKKYHEWVKKIGIGESFFMNFRFFQILGLLGNSTFGSKSCQNRPIFFCGLRTLKAVSMRLTIPLTNSGKLL